MSGSPPRPAEPALALHSVGGMQSFRMELEPLGGSFRCRLVGCLGEDAVVEARRHLIGGRCTAALDLGELVHVDEAGLALLAELLVLGCTMEKSTPFLALRLDEFRRRVAEAEENLGRPAASGS